MTQKLLWLVTFRDDPFMLDIRKERGDDHLDYLETNKQVILLAGGLRYAEDRPFVGGAWVVSAANEEEVRKLIENDPYYCPEHRHFDICYWGLALDHMNEVLQL